MARPVLIPEQRQQPEHCQGRLSGGGARHFSRIDVDFRGTLEVESVMAR